jgi:hypothetical protein
VSRITYKNISHNFKLKFDLTIQQYCVLKEIGKINIALVDASSILNFYEQQYNLHLLCGL